MLYRVAIPPHKTAEYPCVYYHAIPNRNCPNPGIELELLIHIMRLVSESDVQLIVVNATGFSRKKIYDYTVVDLINRGEADVSHASMTITEDRMKLVGFMEPIFVSMGYLIYKKQKKYAEPYIHLLNLVPSYIAAWGGFLALLAILIHYYVERQIPQIWKSKFRHRLNYTLFFFWGILLSFIRTHVTITFNTDTLNADPFPDAEAFLAKLESGEYRAITRSNVYITEYLNPVTKTGQWAMYDRLIKVAAINPPELLAAPSVWDDRILNGASNNVLFLSGKYSAKQLQIEAKRPCELTLAEYPSLNLGYDTVMVRKSLQRELRKLDRGSIALTLIEMERLLVKYQGDAGRCESDFTPSRGLRHLSLDHVQGAFLALAIAHGTAILIVIVEMLSYKTLNM